MVAVIGAGGVGLNVIQGAVLAGRARIIAIDREAAPLEVARALARPHAVQPTGKTSDAVKELTGGRGAEYRIRYGRQPGDPDRRDAVHAKGRHRGADRTLAPRRPGQLRMYPFVMQEKRLIGSVYGSGNPLAGHRAAGQFTPGTGGIKLDELATRTYRLEQINEALAALGRGDGGRGVIFTRVKSSR